MENQILSEQFKRMQKLAGILNENEITSDQDLKNRINNLKDTDLHWSKDPENGLYVSYENDNVKLLLTQFLNLIKKVNPNLGEEALEKKKISLSRDLDGFNSKLYAATQKSFSAARGLKDFFEDNLNIFK